GRWPARDGRDLRGAGRRRPGGRRPALDRARLRRGPGVRAPPRPRRPVVVPDGFYRGSSVRAGAEFASSRTRPDRPPAPAGSIALDAPPPRRSRVPGVHTLFAGRAAPPAR